MYAVIQGPMMENLLTRQNLADRWGVHTTTIDRWLREPGFPSPTKVRRRGLSWEAKAVEDWEKFHMKGRGSRHDKLLHALQTMIDEGLMSKTQAIEGGERALLAMVADLADGQPKPVQELLLRAAQKRDPKLLRDLPDPPRGLYVRALSDAWISIHRFKAELRDRETNP